jgi:hypothetical protein
MHRRKARLPPSLKQAFVIFVPDDTSTPSFAAGKC